MTPQPLQREYKIGKELTVRNNLDGQIFVALYKGMLSVDLTKCKPPVIVTLSPGKKGTGLEELKGLDLQANVDPIRRPQLGAR